MKDGIYFVVRAQLILNDAQSRSEESQEHAAVLNADDSVVVLIRFPDIKGVQVHLIVDLVEIVKVLHVNEEGIAGLGGPTLLRSLRYNLLLSLSDFG